MVAVEFAALEYEAPWVYGPVDAAFVEENAGSTAFMHIEKRKAPTRAALLTPKPRPKRPTSTSMSAEPKRSKTFQLSDAPVEQAMVTDLYGSIPPSLWTQSRRNENPGGPFDGPPVLANERIYGVARLVGNGGYSTPKLHVSAVYSGADEAHCERQLVDELERALESSDVQRMGLTRDHRCELRVLIEHEIVCKDCWDYMVKFCETWEVKTLNVYRPTRPPRQSAACELVGGATCMRAAWGNDIILEKTAHWPCNAAGFKLRQTNQTKLFFECGCGHVHHL